MSDGSIVYEIHDTSCGFHSLEDCPYGMDDCEECQQFLESFYEGDGHEI